MVLAIAALGGGVALLFLILCGVPIAFAMILVGVVGFAMQVGIAPAMTLLANEPVSTLSSVDMATLPLFILMGTFTHIAGFSDDIFKAVAAVIGHRRGGLGFATISGSAAFGALCGSSTATAATFTKVAMPQMLGRGYGESYAAGCIAAGGSIKALIPPSTVMILYCIIAKAYIFDMFIAALVPAVITIVFNVSAAWITARLDPAAAPALERVTRQERCIALRRAVPAAGLMMVIFAGLYSGFFTLNEAAGVAVILSLAAALGRGRLNFTSLTAGMTDTAAVAGMIYMILIGASIFSYFVSGAQIPDAVISALSGFSPTATILLLVIMYLFLGAVFDEIAALLITIPIVLPLVVSLGYDPIWWGIINLVLIELGMITPPIGVIVFVIHGMAPKVSLSRIYRGVMPFVIANLLVLAVLISFPELSLWLLRELR